jgi:predicted RNA binding protein YcfA (HicA-like mRNA interferase family)
MGKLKPLPPKKVLRKLKAVGFIEIHQRGSHLTLKNKKTNRYATVPVHSKDIPIGTLYNIIVKQAGLSVDEFNEI